jgi:hypothetical protein
VRYDASAAWCVRVTVASELPEGRVVVGLTERAVRSIALLADFLLPAGI